MHELLVAQTDAAVTVKAVQLNSMLLGVQDDLIEVQAHYTRVLGDMQMLQQQLHELRQSAVAQGIDMPAASSCDRWGEPGQAQPPNTPAWPEPRLHQARRVRRSFRCPVCYFRIVPEIDGAMPG